MKSLPWTGWHEMAYLRVWAQIVEAFHCKKKIFLWIRVGSSNVDEQEVVVALKVDLQESFTVNSKKVVRKSLTHKKC